MKERNSKIIEIILKSMCFVSLLFICNSIKPMLISFICYFVYKTIKEIIFFIKRMKQKETNKTADTILLSERVICYIALIWFFLYYLF